MVGSVVALDPRGTALKPAAGVKAIVFPFPFRLNVAPASSAAVIVVGVVNPPADDQKLFGVKNSEQDPGGGCENRGENTNGPPRTVERSSVNTSVETVPGCKIATFW